MVEPLVGCWDWKWVSMKVVPRVVMMVAWMAGWTVALMELNLVGLLVQHLADWKVGMLAASKELKLDVSMAVKTAGSMVA